MDPAEAGLQLPVVYILYKNRYINLTVIFSLQLFYDHAISKIVLSALDLSISIALNVALVFSWHFASHRKGGGQPWVKKVSDLTLQKPNKLYYVEERITLKRGKLFGFKKEEIVGNGM